MIKLIDTLDWECNIEFNFDKMATTYTHLCNHIGTFENVKIKNVNNQIIGKQTYYVKEEEESQDNT